MSARPVAPGVYDEDWIAAAWGDSRNQEILSAEPLHPRPRLARALALAQPAAGLRLLDIACGRGEMVALAAAAGADAFGIFFSRDAWWALGKGSARYIPRPYRLGRGMEWPVPM